MKSFLIVCKCKCGNNNTFGRRAESEDEIRHDLKAHPLFHLCGYKEDHGTFESYPSVEIHEQIGPFPSDPEDKEFEDTVDRTAAEFQKLIDENDRLKRYIALNKKFQMENPRERAGREFWERCVWENITPMGPIVSAEKADRALEEWKKRFDK